MLVLRLIESDTDFDCSIGRLRGVLVRRYFGSDWQAGWLQRWCMPCAESVSPRQLNEVN